MDWSMPASSVQEILQARIPEGVAIPFSRGSSQPRDLPWVSCIAGRFFTCWATREDPNSPGVTEDQPHVVEDMRQGSNKHLGPQRHFGQVSGVSFSPIS